MHGTIARRCAAAPLIWGVKRGATASPASTAALPCQSEDIHPPHTLISQQNSASFSPPASSMPTIPPSRSRIHRKALRRGGVGAGREGKTRNLMHRACGKWSPSGDTGEAAGYRTDPAVSAPNGASGVPVRHTRGRNWRMRRHRPQEWKQAGRWQHFPPYRQGVRYGCQTAMPFPETGGQHPPVPPLQRDRSRGQKPPNGAPEGVTYLFSVEAASGAPSECSLKPHGRNRRVDRRAGPCSAVLVAALPFQQCVV